MDIDIDFPSTFDIRTLIKSAIPASMVKNGELVKHNCGYYFQPIPIDKHTGVAAIPYEEAAAVGYFKIDFLHLTTLNNFQSKREIRELIKHDPNWDLLLDEAHVQKLSQIHNHVDLLKKIKPRSVQELADCIALIRPAKRYLIDTYAKLCNVDRAALRIELYSRPTNNKNWYKKAHAVAYALTIVLEMHLLRADLL